MTESTNPETRVDGVKHARDRPVGGTKSRKINRNATTALLNEMGFVGAEVKMATRDYALIDLRDLPQVRRQVAETYFENTAGYYREPEVTGFQWGSQL